MAASINDKFTDTYNAANPNVARVTVSRTAGGTSLTCDNLAGWPTSATSKVHFSTYQINTSNQVVAGTQIDWYGIVSGNTIGSLTRITGATDTGSSVGDVVELNPTGSWGHDLYTGLTAEHNKDGTHGAVTATSLTTTGAVTAGNGLTLTAGTLSLPATSINQSALPLGVPVQVVSTTSSAVSTGTTIIPQDDTIPQNTEGFEVMTLAITPKATTNKLVIDVNIYGGSSVADDLIIALFQDSTANALAAVGVPIGASGGSVLHLVHTIDAGTTSATTFRVRFGGSQAGTRTFNGRIGARVFGAITKSSIVITEYKA